MEKVKICIEGKATYYEWAGKPQLEENDNDWCSVYYSGFIFEKIEKVTANGEDITKTKGKYLMVPNMIREQWSLGEDHEFPVEVRPVRTIDFDVECEVECDDFKPDKVQLRKSTYEFNFIPFAIDTTKIMYDGKEVETSIDDWCDFCDRWGYGESQAIIVEE
jgi:hypothetical protein